MKNAKITFTGDPVIFFFCHIMLGLLVFFTLGLAFPYYVYWNMKYLAEHCEISSSK